MTLREEIVADIQNLPENVLPELQKTVKELSKKESKPTFMQRLLQIKIDDLPADYSRNIDLYLSGEKKIDEETN